MRIAVIKSGVVEDIVMAGPDFVPPSGRVAIPTDTANIGYTFDGKDFTAPDPNRTKQELLKSADFILTGVTRKKSVFLIGSKKLMSDLLPQTRSDLADLASWAAENPEGSKVWCASDGSRTELSSTDLITFYTTVRDANLSLYDSYNHVIDDINAGLIFATEQIVLRLVVVGALE